MPFDPSSAERYDASSNTRVDRRHAGFDTTRWSVILAAGGPSSPQHAAALQLLCTRYWLPVYAFIRRGERDIHQAQDLTQEFFAQLLEREMLVSADPTRGRFRSFLLTCLKRFLINQRERAASDSFLKLQVESL